MIVRRFLAVSASASPRPGSAAQSASASPSARGRTRGLVALLVAGAFAGSILGGAPAAAATKPRKRSVDAGAPAGGPSAGAPGAAAPNGPATPPAGASPSADLKKTNAELKRLLQRQKPSWSPEAELKNTEVRKVVDGLLDFEELGRRALVKHWDSLSAKQRSEFVATLRQLVERNYLKQVYGQPDYDIKFGEEKVTGKEASVLATLQATRRGKKVNMALEYKLVYKPGRWVVYDVVTDDLSLLENYRAEFNKIIAKEGFAKLLERMKKKLAEQK
jgi:phospholipid transport system substrate-binding protein